MQRYHEIDIVIFPFVTALHNGRRLLIPLFKAENDLFTVHRIEGVMKTDSGVEQVFSHGLMVQATMTQAHHMSAQ